MTTSVANDEVGIGALVARLQPLGPALVVCAAALNSPAYAISDRERNTHSDCRIPAAARPKPRIAQGVKRRAVQAAIDALNESDRGCVDLARRFNDRRKDDRTLNSFHHGACRVVGLRSATAARLLSHLGRIVDC